uniref:Uncharacterized protein n=1 Tax=Vitis vinifera TaxID=29760 RepID=F6H9N2_VITVI
MSLKDVVTENEFEKRLLADATPPSDIEVTFDDIGALENVNDSLKRLWTRIFHVHPHSIGETRFLFVKN